MSKKFCEKNLVFSNKNVASKLKKDGAVLKNAKTDVVATDFEEKTIITNEQLKKDLATAKVFSNLLVISNIVTNIVFLFFLPSIIDGLDFSNGLQFDWTFVNILGIIIFVYAQVSGVVLFVDMFKKQPFRRKLIMATAPLTLVFLVGVWLVLSVDRFEGETETGIVKLLNLQNFDPSVIDIKYVIIACVAYLIIFYFLFGWLVKKYAGQVKQMADKKNIK